MSDRSLRANILHTALESAFPPPDQHPYAQDVLVGIEIKREKLGLAAGQRPGDIDLLVVPLQGDRPSAKKAIAIEVKIVRPTLRKPGKNADTTGSDQARGLLHDGFPYVCLLHLCAPEPLPKALHWSLPYVEHEPGVGLVETGRRLLIDPFPLMSAPRQEGRLRALGLPAEIGYTAIGLPLTKDGQGFSGCTFGENHLAQLNPVTLPPLAARIESLIAAEANLFQLIRWFA